MNLRSEDRYGAYGEFSRCYSTSLYKERSESNVTENKNTLRGEQKSHELLKNKSHEDDFRFSGNYKLNKVALPSLKHSNTLVHLDNMPSQSILCSKYLNKDSSKYPVPHETSTIEKTFSNHDANIKIYKGNSETKVIFRDCFEEHIGDELNKRCHEKLFSDKTTFCRPVLNLYNQEFLYKTIEKNARLQRLVKELVIARQKEKDSENWKKYINELRRKHLIDTKIRCSSSFQNVCEDSVVPDTIEDYYNTRFKCRQSDPCQDLLQDFYNAHDIRPCYCDTRTIQGYKPFETNSLCYPISSQGRRIMLERERLKQLSCNGCKTCHKTIDEEHRAPKTIIQKNYGIRKSFMNRNSRCTNTTMMNSTQTEPQLLSPTNLIVSNKCNAKPDFLKKINDVETNNVKILKENAQNINNNSHKNSLASIEEKLEILIRSINTLIMEMKTKRSSPRRYLHQPAKMGNVCYTRSDGCNIARKESIVCGFIDSSLRSTRNSSDNNFQKIQNLGDNLTKTHDLLLKGFIKNKINMKDVSDVDMHHPRSVQISVTIPTKETSTEVTRSLSKAGQASCLGDNFITEDTPRSNDKRIAIAVNTDPVSLLAMLRASTEETLRRLLSYMPTIDYYSYLYRLAPPPRPGECDYICNICGAAFLKPSALTDHIQKHDLGKTRNCCICRQALERPRRHPGLFKCQYCGQRFTRAYCCELHQDSCARRLGKVYDVPSSLVLLR